MNVITIELCPEDRARLDRLADALERKTCDKCVAAALEFVGQTPDPSPDPIQQKLAETMAKVSTPPPAPAPDPVPEVSLAEFQKALTLRCAESEAMKAKVRTLIHEYADTVSLVAPEKRAEVLAKLAKL